MYGYAYCGKGKEGCAIGNLQKSKVFAVIICLVLFVFLSACDGTTKKDNITVQALYGQTVLDLPIRSRQLALYSQLNNTGNFFKTNKNYPQILEIVEEYALENSGRVTSLETRTPQALITFESEGKLDQFLLSSLGDNTYIINTVQVDIRFEGYESGFEKSLLLPIYLTNDIRLTEPVIVQTMDEGVEYELAPGVSVDDVYAFYKDSGWFDVEMKDGKLILNDFNGKPDGYSQSINYPLVFHFETHVGTMYFKIIRGE